MRIFCPSLVVLAEHICVLSVTWSGWSVNTDVIKWQEGERRQGELKQIGELSACTVISSLQHWG